MPQSGLFDIRGGIVFGLGQSDQQVVYPVSWQPATDERCDVIVIRWSGDAENTYIDGTSTDLHVQPGVHTTAASSAPPSNSPATFTALRAGSSVSYATDSGVTGSFTVTVAAAEPDTASSVSGDTAEEKEDKSNPGTGVSAHLPFLKGGVRTAKRSGQPG